MCDGSRVCLDRFGFATRTEGEPGIFCYECHEELLHNLVLLPEDLEILSRLVRARGLGEDVKPAGKELLAGRIRLLHEAIAVGLRALDAHVNGAG